jgi:FtsP/CotA-like multicopper oxidase with cupredoxin domain
VAPLPQENGWKDTVIMYPGQVTRIKIRYAPMDLGVTTLNYYPFDPSGGDYVWHCHIIDHEDNEMMRRLNVDPLGSGTNPGTPARTYTNY